MPLRVNVPAQNLSQVIAFDDEVEAMMLDEPSGVTRVSASGTVYFSIFSMTFHFI